MPIIAIAWLAVSGGGGNWPHVMENVIPRATGRTLLLVSLTGASTAVIGILTAWLVASCEFPLRRFLSAALVLPLAIPAYLAAYAFGELLTFTGPVQSLVRFIFGFKTSRDYWFPDIRSLGGAVLVLSSVLYPYIYLACRSMFLMQGRAAADVARTLGAGPLKVFFRIQIPMARPAIMIGMSIPLSFMMAFLVAQSLGMTINMMVMFGLVIAVGVLVDDPVVVVEYAERKLQEGVSKKEAFILAVRKMFVPVVGATATTLGAFVPLLFMAQLKAPGLIESAAGVTIAGTVGLMAVVHFTRKDFSFLRGLLMWGGVLALIAIGASVLVDSIQLGTWFSVAMIGFAGAAILYDTQTVLRHFPEDRYVGAALQLFSSVALMFWYVLNLLLSSRR